MKQYKYSVEKKWEKRVSHCGTTIQFGSVEPNNETYIFYSNNKNILRLEGSDNTEIDIININFNDKEVKFNYHTYIRYPLRKYGNSTIKFADIEIKEN